MNLVLLNNCIFATTKGTSFLTFYSKKKLFTQYKFNFATVFQEPYFLQIHILCTILLSLTVKRLPI